MQTLSIRDTRTELIRFVFPRNANPRGYLYGGQMMYWIVETGMLSASRVARGPVVLASMESLDFVEPVQIGDVLLFRAYVEAVGKTSMEVAVFAEVRHPERQHERGVLCTVAYLTYVAVDEDHHPRPVPTKVVALDPYEDRIMQAALERREQRASRIADRKERLQDVRLRTRLRHTLDYVRLVFPDDTVFGNIMFAGKLLFELDQAASILAMRFAQGGVVTASVDAMDFYAPIRVGHALHIKLAVNYLGRSSMEIGAKILGENPATGELLHTATSFLTFVHVDEQGHPVALKKRFVPETEEEKEIWEQAEARKQMRLARRRQRFFSPEDAPPSSAR